MVQKFTKTRKKANRGGEDGRKGQVRTGKERENGGARNSKWGAARAQRRDTEISNVARKCAVRSRRHGMGSKKSPTASGAPVDRRMQQDSTKL